MDANPRGETPTTLPNHEPQPTVSSGRTNLSNRRMRTRMSWWCGRAGWATTPPMPIQRGGSDSRAVLSGCRPCVCATGVAAAGPEGLQHAYTPFTIKPSMSLPRSLLSPILLVLALVFASFGCNRRGQPSAGAASEAEPTTTEVATATQAAAPNPDPSAPKPNIDGKHVMQ